MNLDGDKETFSLKEHFARHAREFDDLQHEMAGRNVGRISRFLSGSARSDETPAKRQAKASDSLMRLQVLLQTNASYAALYRETETLLQDTQSRLEQALEQVQQKIAETEASLEDKLGRAARLPDGTHVFRDRDGQVRTEGGARVPDELIATIIWSGAEPSYEEVVAAQARLEALKSLQDDIAAGQAEIGDMQAAMADEDNPPTAEALEGFEERAEEIRSGIEERLSRELGAHQPPAEDAEVQPAAVSTIAVPEL